MAAKTAVSRSVQAPETLDDLLDQLDNVSRAKALLQDIGLLSTKIAKAIDDTQADISAKVATRIKFPAGSRPLIVRHINDQTNAETLFVYTSIDGVDRFESVQVVESTSLSAEPPPAEPPVEPPAPVPDQPPADQPAE